MKIKVDGKREVGGNCRRKTGAKEWSTLLMTLLKNETKKAYFTKYIFFFDRVMENFN